VFPQRPGAPETTFRFEGDHLVGFQPVMQGKRRLGTLYVRSDLRAIDTRVRFYGGVVALTLLASGLLAYLISRQLQHRISRPILDLAQVATAISTRRDYSVRAAPSHAYEVDQLTGAFNHMLQEVQDSESRLRMQLAHLSLLQQITRATSDRQDLASIFRVVLQSLEEDLPVDFGCILQQDPASRVLAVAALGPASANSDTGRSLRGPNETAASLDTSGLSDCLNGQLIYEPDASALPMPLFQRLAEGGLRSVVIAPLVAESTLFSALLVGRRQPQAFGSTDC
jgi:nitrate/nitrite-specific signal transduction histidine kinase